jgi:hypothetical protein
VLYANEPEHAHATVAEIHAEIHDEVHDEARRKS